MPPADSKTGLLLVNLGTPDSPRTGDVRRYLREFLSDPRVLSMPAPARWLLLNLVILPFRPRKSAAAYREIWQPEGSPLLLHSEALARGVGEALGSDYVVELAMRYGRPRIDDALERLAQAEVARIVVLPLFPQYSAAATGSAVARVMEGVARRWDTLPVTIIGDFHDEPGFIEAFATTAGPRLREFEPDHVLMSYHGLPEDQLQRSDSLGGRCLASPDCCDAKDAPGRGCYRAQCLATTRALGSALDLDEQRCSSSFQSRLGRTQWIQPYTDEVLPTLAEQGVKRLAVLCPAFVADCLETLEEIGIRLREQWRELGGEDMLLCPCPNADPTWVRAVADMARRHASVSR
jgi:ferrochelatase